jgi:hypothetical protein
MANEGYYDYKTGDGYAQHKESIEKLRVEKENYENSEEFKTKIQEELNKLEQYLVKNSYKKLQPGVDKFEKGKVYYIVKRNSLGGAIKAIKVKCIEVNSDGTGNFEGFDGSFAASGTQYKNISFDSYDGDKKNFFGVWYRKASFNTVFGIGSATKYTAGKKLRKSKKSRKSKQSKRKGRKGRKGRKTIRH